MTCIHDKMTGYEYHFDYCGHYFDLQRCETWQYVNVQADFVRNLTNFLRAQLQVHYSTACAIAHSVFIRMSDSNLRYHTPLHPLSAFQFAYQNGITLEPWEHLSLWFHDAIYTPDAKNGLNESQSAAYMRAIIPYGHLADNKVMNEAERSILFTAEHLGEVEERFELVLDLDLCSLAWEPKVFDTAAKLVQRESNSFMSLRAFKVSQKRFFGGLAQKGSYFRTDKMIKAFEGKAQCNVDRWLSTILRTVG